MWQVAIWPSSPQDLCRLQLECPCSQVEKTELGGCKEGSSGLD